jgi:hypothetical protein
MYSQYLCHKNFYIYSNSLSSVSSLLSYYRKYYLLAYSYTPPSYAAMQHWYNKTRLHVTKFFCSCTTTVLSHKCTWGKYITIDPCYHNNRSLLGIQLKQSIHSETSTQCSSVCQLPASVLFSWSHESRCTMYLLSRKLHWLSNFS